jgi:hypothetical protein
VDSIQGKGQYVGTYLAWGVHNNGWWGEGEIKFYMDGDTQFLPLMARARRIIFAALMILIPERKMTQVVKQLITRIFYCLYRAATGDPW